MLEANRGLCWDKRQIEGDVNNNNAPNPCDDD